MVATRMRDTAFKRMLRAMLPDAAIRIDGPFADLTLHNNMTRTAVWGKDWMKDKAVSAQDYVMDQGKEFHDRFKEVAEVIGRR